MTSQQHFERWLKNIKPSLSLDYDDKEGFYYHDIVQLMWMAWKESPKTRPTMDTKITKERLKELHECDYATLCDRLRGIYPNISTPYAVSPLQKYAADVIEAIKQPNQT